MGDRMQGVSRETDHALPRSTRETTSCRHLCQPVLQSADKQNAAAAGRDRDREREREIERDRERERGREAKGRSRGGSKVNQFAFELSESESMHKIGRRLTLVR